jgi:hypothetical protein
MITRGELVPVLRKATGAAANLLTQKILYGNNGEVITGSMADKEGDNACSSSSVSSTTLKLVAPTGFYDGDDTVTLTDADFTAANIKNGVDIMGVTGTYKQTSTITYTRVALTNAQDISTGYADISWESEVNDDDGCWDSGDATKLVVPAGKSTAVITGFVVFTNDGTGSRGAKIIKNNTDTIATITADARNETGLYVTTGVIAVSEDDYFELQGYSGSSSYDLLGNTWGGPCWFEIEFRS